MSSPALLDLFVTLARRPHTQCLHHLRSTPSQCIRYASTLPPSAPSPPTSSTAAKVPLHVGLDRNPQNMSAISRIPIPRGVRGEDFTPSILSRPLGLSYAPQSGQNSPYDSRSWSERKNEFASRDKAMERRRVYLRSYLRPYFQEWKRMDFHKGKVFRSNERMFKREKALWFPNLVGETLTRSVGEGETQGKMDSVGVMRGKISVVGMMSGQWAEEQVDHFLGAKQNEELQKILEGNKGRVQRVDVNMQPDWLKMMLVKLFKGRLRKLIPEERWRSYFMVKLPRDIRRGLTEETRDAMGLLNSQVGYVYLVDSQCKIRWAASGFPWDGEIEGLNDAIKRLIEEEKDTAREKSMINPLKKSEPPATSRKASKMAA